MLGDPVEELSLQLVKLIRGLRGLHVAVVDAGGHHVEPAVLGLLAGLATTGPARLSTLASVMCLDLSTVSRQVPALEKHGWVARTRDPADHRAQLLELTPSGHEMLQDVRRSRAQVLAQLLPDWSTADVKQFAAQLARFNDDVTAHRQDAISAAVGGTPTRTPITAGSERA
jgi:DNA-binding MarR family transcriptional regulator